MARTIKIIKLAKLKETLIECLSIKFWINSLVDSSFFLILNIDSIFKEQTKIIMHKIKSIKYLKLRLLSSEQLWSINK